MNKYTEDQVDVSLLIGTKRERIRKLDLEIAGLVKDGRDVGMSWAMLGAALGTSSQAAWERYGLSFSQMAQRSRQNNAAMTNTELEGLDLPPQVAPQPAKRRGKSPRSQADK
jgi:hypothetical protein